MEAGACTDFGRNVTAPWGPGRPDPGVSASRDCAGSWNSGVALGAVGQPGGLTGAPALAHEMPKGAQSKWGSPPSSSNNNSNSTSTSPRTSVEIGPSLAELSCSELSHIRTHPARSRPVSAPFPHGSTRTRFGLFVGLPGSFLLESSPPWPMGVFTSARPVDSALAGRPRPMGSPLPRGSPWHRITGISRAVGVAIVQGRLWR